MAASVIADAGFLIALLNRRDRHHGWALDQARRLPPSLKTCDAALSEAFHLLAKQSTRALVAMLRRHTLVSSFVLSENLEHVLGLVQKYSDVPMSFADACLVRMTETLTDPILLTTDTDFRIYRRHNRQTVPSVIPD
jgi:predicted nucleic acid-binding protein